MCVGFCFVCLSVQGDALQSLITTATSFETLLKVFEHQTRSPGVKACYDLKVFLDSGIHSWPSVGPLLP